MNELALFAGAGGGILGGHLLGWRTVCAVEWEPYAASVLAARQNDGLLPFFPIWDDVQTFDGKPWRGVVDVVSGGFPCQDISVAGKGAGIDGARSGMWAHMARIVGEVRPRFVFVENSPALVNRGLGRVLGDLATLGYDTEWGVLGAANVGAPHQRDRFWLVAYACGKRYELADEALRAGRHAVEPGGEIPNADRWCGLPWRLGREQCPQDDEDACAAIGTLWAAEPNVGRVAHGVAARLDRLKALGNGQVPACAAEAFRQLSARFGG